MVMAGTRRLTKWNWQQTRSVIRCQQEFFSDLSVGGSRSNPRRLRPAGVRDATLRGSGWRNPILGWLRLCEERFNGTKTSTSAENVGNLFFPLSASWGLRVEATVSPLVERKMVIAGTLAESFPKAEQHLQSLADLKISAARIRRTTRRSGQARIELRQHLRSYFESLPLPEQSYRVPDGTVAPDMAVVMLDGGRLQILDRLIEPAARTSPRKKGEHWKESRIGLLLNMSGTSHSHDPCPELPDFLAGGSDLEKKLSEIGHLIAIPENQGKTADSSAELSAPACSEGPTRRRRRGRDAKPLTADQRPLPGPDLLYRVCVASRDCWDDFGKLMAAEAWQRGFAGAQHKVCVTDGSDAIRRVLENYFSHYVHVLDLMHALGYAMNAARAVGGGQSEIRVRYRSWAELIWQGKVNEVIQALKEHQSSLGNPPPEASADDPREALRRSCVYFTNQQSRMNYPEYRKQGFPLTSSLMESAVKQVNRRVKGSEKFWSESGGDELLALRADAVSDGDKLSEFLRQLNQPNDGFRQYSHAA